MTALWIHEVVDRFWANVGEVPLEYPRDLADVLLWAVPVDLAPIPDLRIAAIDSWLAERQSEFQLAMADRPLRAAIVVHDGCGVLFVDSTDPPDERRFSIAHELAHYLVEYDAPRRQVGARLGPSAIAVLDGRRAATWDERLQAVLSGVSLATTQHLMERTPDGHLPGQHVSQAEQQADDLAFELLAPFDAVRARLSGGADRRAVETLLCETFGLPPSQAHVYARHLAPEPPAGSLFRRLFSVS